MENSRTVTGLKFLSMPLRPEFFYLQFYLPSYSQFPCFRKIKLKLRQNIFFVGLNYSLHMTKTHGKLKHDYITGSCVHGHSYLGSTMKENSQTLGNTSSSRPNLIMFFGPPTSRLNSFFCKRKKY